MRAPLLIQIALLLICLTTIPVTGHSQKKIKIKNGLRHETFRIGDKVSIYRNYYDSFEAVAEIRGFTSDAIIFDDPNYDTLLVSEILAIDHVSNNVAQFMTIPGIATIPLFYASPFLGITKEGYNLKRFLIIAVSCLGYDALTLGIALYENRTPIRLCDAKVKIK